MPSLISCISCGRSRTEWSRDSHRTPCNPPACWSIVPTHGPSTATPPGPSTVVLFVHPFRVLLPARLPPWLVWLQPLSPSVFVPISTPPTPFWLHWAYPICPPTILAHFRPSPLSFSKLRQLWSVCNCRQNSSLILALSDDAWAPSAGCSSTLDRPHSRRQSSQGVGLVPARGIDVGLR